MNNQYKGDFSRRFKWNSFVINIPYSELHDFSDCKNNIMTITGNVEKHT